jgi:hypothetical protein
LNASRFDSLRTGSLQWLPELGLGWFPVEESPYDAGYWERYRRMDTTSTAESLTKARREWVRRFWSGQVCDIGIGGGRFVTDMGATGYDINPHAEEWLRRAGRWQNPYTSPLAAVTCWDSLEHIHDPAPLLANVREWVFASLPIFDGPDHVLRSKHYRRDEHCWYFTNAGLIWFMERQGFQFADSCTIEQDCGREDIHTYAFHRSDK